LSGVEMWLFCVGLGGAGGVGGWGVAMPTSL